MWMIQHEPFDDSGAECDSLGIVDGDARAFRRRSHARHHDFALRIVLVLSFANEKIVGIEALADPERLRKIDLKILDG